MTATHAAHVAGRVVEALSVPTLVAVLSIASACGGGSGSPSAPTPTPATPTADPSISATITIRSGLDPKDVRIEPGQRVRVVNQDTRAHMLRSEPHPTHGSCPPIDASGMLQPGASVDLGPFNLSGTCYYHDHNDAENADLRGQIRIGVDSPGPGPGYLRP